LFNNPKLIGDSPHFNDNPKENMNFKEEKYEYTKAGPWNANYGAGKFDSLGKDDKGGFGKF